MKSVILGLLFSVLSLKLLLSEEDSYIYIYMQKDQKMGLWDLVANVLKKMWIWKG